MNCRKLFSFLFFPMLIHFSYCQSFDADSKAFGKLVLSGETLEGTISINLAMNQVLFTQGNSMKIYGAREIQKVLVDDHPTYVGQQLDKQYFLFEVIAQGHITILYREGIVKDEFNHTEYPGFFYEKDGELLALEKKKDFMDLFGNDEKWMALNIKNNNLDLDYLADIKKAFDYYNQTQASMSPSP